MLSLTKCPKCENRKIRKEKGRVQVQKPEFPMISVWCIMAKMGWDEVRSDKHQMSLRRGK